LPRYETEAKERQATSTGGKKPQLREKIPYPEKGKATEHAAVTVGVNPRYVSDFKKIKQRDPLSDTEGPILKREHLPASEAAFDPSHEERIGKACFRPWKVATASRAGRR
jgi:hypothetical protein